jgi:AraC-like DNA-binding protein
VTGAVWRALRDGARVDATADAVGLTPRHLHRRCLHAFGYGPKTLARVLRFDRALGLARAGDPLATVAARSGYADQAHLAREVRAFAGLPIGALLAESARRSAPGGGGDDCDDEDHDQRDHHRRRDQRRRP